MFPLLADQRSQWAADPCRPSSQHLLLPHCQVKHIIPRDILPNGFCGESFTWAHGCLSRLSWCAGCPESHGNTQHVPKKPPALYLPYFTHGHILRRTRDTHAQISWCNRLFLCHVCLRMDRPSHLQESYIYYKHPQANEEYNKGYTGTVPPCPLKRSNVMIGLKSILSREQIILRKTVNICFVTWPPLWQCQLQWGWAPFTFSMRASRRKWVTASVISFLLSFFLSREKQKQTLTQWRQ